MAEIYEILNAIPFAIFIFDNNCNLTMANSKARMIGYAPEELKGKHISELQLLEEQDVRRVCNRLEEASFVIESKAIKKDGRAIPVQISVSKLKDGHLLVMRDIGDIKRAQEYIQSMARKDIDEIRGAKEYAEKILSNIPAPVVLFDEDGVRKYVNEFFERFYGFKKEEVIGTELDFLYSKYEIAKVRDAFELCKKEGFSECETVVKRKDGSRIPALLKFSAIRNGKTEVLALAVDISPLKKTQKFVEDLLKKVPVPASLFDENGKRMMANETFEKFYKYPAGNIINSSLCDIYPEEYHKAITEAFEKSMRESYSSCEVEVLRGDGVIMPVVINFSSLRDSEGRTVVIGTATDVGGLKRREEELKKVLDSLPVAVWRSDREKRCIYINEEFTRLLGWTREDLIGVKDYEAPYVCDERTSLCTMTWSEIMHEVWDTIEKGGRPEAFEIPLRTKDGRIVVHRAVEIPLDDGDLWASMDITMDKII
jgi:PAS domain S-box-containing protein